MNAYKLEETLANIEQTMGELAPERRPELFHQFLIKGYRAITLSSVTKTQTEDLLRAKLCLGSLITLYDDFADRPSQFDPELLEILYQLRFGQGCRVTCLNARHRRVLEFSQALFLEMESILEKTPNFAEFFEVLNFDLAQFYNANQYSSLMTNQPLLGNRLENRLYAHHNMGMVIAGTMDLMASENVVISELGDIREVFLIGQRLGRIFNVLATERREKSDHDVTGELAVCRCESDREDLLTCLNQEILTLFRRLEVYLSKITTFSVADYMFGLREVQALHQAMQALL